MPRRKAIREHGLDVLLADVSSVELRELPIDDAWRDAVRSRLKELAVHRRELADWVGCVQSLTTYILNGAAGRPATARRSDFVERISLALRIPLPDSARVELAVAKLVAMGDLARLQLIVANAEMLAKG